MVHYPGAYAHVVVSVPGPKPEMAYLFNLSILYELLLRLPVSAHTAFQERRR